MKRIPSLDGLRAMSILMVLVAHLASTGRAWRFLSAYGTTGVRMFFVISGYLITTLLLKEQARSAAIDLRGFYVRRAYRILPAAGAFMLFALVVYWREFTWINIGAMLLYLVNFDRSTPWIVGHLWSLSVEEQFYLAWPGALKKLFPRKVEVLCAVMVMSPVFSALCFHFKVPGGGYPMFPAVADNLAAGCLLAIVASRVPAINLPSALIMLLAVLLIPFYPADSPSKTIFQLFILWPLMNFSMAGILLHVVRKPYRVLNARPVVWLGQISYSLYLWQQPFFFAKNQPAYKLLFGLALACISYYWIEKPFLMLREKQFIASRVVVQE
jgi:peptidoglycan/LPS O-acetylase OafA/YrhL